VSRAPRISVVIATFNRLDLLKRLIGELAAQTLSPDAFEVVIVDDGSTEPVPPQLAGIATPFAMKVHRHDNQGAAATRHQGAVLARGDVIVFIDDDMQIPKELLAEHLRLHEQHPNALVLGRIRTDPTAVLPLFERFHLRVLDRFADDVRDGRVVARGSNVWTGNVSMRRDAYLAVGGFDRTLGRSEDSELGIRLEKAGAKILLSEAAYSVHGTDHTSLETWLSRAFKYGIFDLRISKKHPDALDVSPWRYFRSLSKASRPFLTFALVAPRAAHVMSRAAMKIALAADRVGLEKVGIAGTTFVYGVEYARGLREESGDFAGAITDYAEYAEKSGDAPGALLRLGREAFALEHAVRADHDTVLHYAAKYGGQSGDPDDLPKDMVQKVGFQIMGAYRLMRFFTRARVPLAPKIVSRLIRHLYGSDIHWDADFEPGVLIVHGMGLAISHSAKVASGAIIFQNVTLGMGTHPETRAVGAPSIGKNVVVGAGSTLLGPITIGEGTKIMPSCVLVESVPEQSLVITPEATVKPRVRPRGEAVATPIDRTRTNGS
jgi:serine acetyltransferase/GT2 family glycosyltransferase